MPTLIGSAAAQGQKQHVSSATQDRRERISMGNILHWRELCSTSAEQAPCGPFVSHFPSRESGPLGEEFIMEWEGREESTNVEDRRGLGPGGGVAVGGIGALILGLLALIFGGDSSRFAGPDPNTPANVKPNDA